VSPRSKFRLRWYTYTNLKSDGWKFEEKIKIDELGYKQITVLDAKKFEKIFCHLSNSPTELKTADLLRIVTPSSPNSFAAIKEIITRIKTAFV
jgi:hypothetical protein